MSDQTTAPQVEEAQAAPAALAKPADSVALDASAAPVAGDVTKTADDSVKPMVEEPAKAEDVPMADKPEASANESAPPAEKSEPEAKASDKVEDMVTDRTEPEPQAQKASDESVEIKMETSSCEDKPVAEDKANNDAAHPPESTQPPTATVVPANPQVPVESKEAPATEVKTTIAENEQPQPLKQQQQQQPILPTRQYLDATVVPILHSALSQLAKVRPEDPIQFLGQYLLDYKKDYVSDRK